MALKYVHYNGCSNRQGDLCAYTPVRVICPREGDPCRNSQHGQGKPINKGDQSANRQPFYHFQGSCASCLNGRSNTQNSSGVEQVCFEI